MLNLIIAVLFIAIVTFPFHSLSSIEGTGVLLIRKIIRVVGTY